MGLGQSLRELQGGGPDENTKERLMTRYNLTEGQVHKLYKRFQKLDRDKDGYLTYADLDLASTTSLIKERVILAFLDTPKHELVDRQTQKRLTKMSFIKYVDRLMIWQKGSADDKLMFLFRIFDVQKERKLTRQNIKTLLWEMMGSTMSDAKRNDTAVKMLAELKALSGDESKEEHITLQQFVEGCRGLEDEMKINILDSVCFPDCFSR